MYPSKVIILTAEPTCYKHILTSHRPPDCPDCLYELMSQCLEYNGDDRPKFTDIEIYLDNLNNVTGKEANSDSLA